MTNDGKLNGIDLTFYVDCGSSPNEIDVAGAQMWADNGAFCIVFWLNHSALEHGDFHLSTIMHFFSLSWSARCYLFLHQSTLTSHWINFIINSYSSSASWI